MQDQTDQFKEQIKALEDQLQDPNVYNNPERKVGVAFSHEPI